MWLPNVEEDISQIIFFNNVSHHHSDKSARGYIMKKMKEIFVSLYKFRYEQWGHLFIAFEDKELETALRPALIDCHFDAVEPTADWDKLIKKIDYRILKMTSAGLKVQKHMEQLKSEMGSWGDEIIKNHYYYQLYCLKDQALFVYAAGGRIWEVGIHPLKWQESGMKVLLHRFLSLNLIKSKVVGFWGDYQGDVFKLKSLSESKGSCVYFDLKNHQVLTTDGQKKLVWPTQIERHGNSYPEQGRSLDKEEIYSSLLIKSSLLRSHFLLDEKLRECCRSIAKMSRATGLNWSTPMSLAGQ